MRLVEPEDIGALVALCLEARSESNIGPQLCTSDAELLADQLRVFASGGEGRILLAFVEDALAGLLLARVVEPGLFIEERAVHVEAIFVAAAFRRRGIGHGLLVELAAMAEEAGVGHLYAVPLPGARGMQRFLARLGFAPAASFRVATLAALQRHLALRGAGGRLAPRSRGIERLIARRRVASESRWHAVASEPRVGKVG